MWKFILLVFTYNILVTSGADSATSLCNSCSSCSNELNQFLTTFASFNFKFLLKLLQVKNEPAVVFSAVPIIYNAGALSIFSCGETRQQLLNMYNVSSVETVVCIINELNRRMAQITLNQDLQVNLNATFLLANSQYPLTCNFICVLEKLRIQTTNIDFEYPNQALEEINCFIKSRTNQSEVDLSIQNTFATNNRFVGLSDLYFRSALRYGYNCCQIYQSNFYPCPNEPVPNVTYITGVLYSKYAYNSVLKSKVIELELQQGLNLIYVLPDSGVDIYGVIETLVTYDVLSLSNTLTYKNVNVTLLYADHLETTFDSVNVTRSVVGNLRIFDYNRAQIKGAVVGDTPMSLTDGYQKMFWRSDYNSSECNACTSQLTECVEETFTVNRPVIAIFTRNNLVYMCAAFLNVI